MKAQPNSNKQPLSSKIKDSKQAVIHEQTDEELEDNIEEEDDEKINDELFSMYDTLFKNFNDFGSIFQKTAHHIGKLIRKNMQLTQKNEYYEEQFDKLMQVNKRNEEAYENLLKLIAEKDRVNEDLLGENTGLKLQMEQFLLQHKPQPQRDILREREEAAKKSTTTSSSSNKPQQVKTVNNLKSDTKVKNSTHNNLIPGTFESFFDFERGPSNQEPDSCSLKDLFSLKNSKKRTRQDLDFDEEVKEESWKKKNKKSYKEDRQIASRFEQLSQAFYNVGNSNSNSLKQRESMDSIGQAIGINTQNMFQEDSASSSSVINAGIRFDAQQAKDNLVQSKLNFNNKNQPQPLSAKKQQQPEKKYEIKMVEQVADSLVDDFFTVKNEKKDRQSAYSSNKQQKSAKSYK